MSKNLRLIKAEQGIGQDAMILTVIADEYSVYEFRNLIEEANRKV